MMDDRLVVAELYVRPDPSREKPFVFVYKFRIDVDEIEAADGEMAPVLPALVLLIEGHSAEVDDAHRPLLL